MLYLGPEHISPALLLALWGMPASARGSNKFSCLNPENSSSKEKSSSSSSQASSKTDKAASSKPIVPKSTPMTKNVSKKMKLNSVSSLNEDTFMSDAPSDDVATHDASNSVVKIVIKGDATNNPPTVTMTTATGADHCRRPATIVSRVSAAPRPLERPPETYRPHAHDTPASHRCIRWLW